MISLPLDPSSVRDGVESVVVLPYLAPKAEFVNCLNWHDEDDASMAGRGTVTVLDVHHTPKRFAPNNNWSRGMEQQRIDNIVTVVLYVARGKAKPEAQNPTATALYVSNAKASNQAQAFLQRRLCDICDRKAGSDKCLTEFCPSPEQMILDAMARFRKEKGFDPCELKISTDLYDLIDRSLFMALVSIGTVIIKKNARSSLELA